MHRKSNSSLFQSHKFYMGLFACLFSFGIISGSQCADIDIELRTQKNTYGSYIINGEIIEDFVWRYTFHFDTNFGSVAPELNIIICDFDDFEDIDNSTNTPCGSFNDLPIYCYYSTTYDTYWCEFDDCPNGMFALKLDYYNQYTDDPAINDFYYWGSGLNPKTTSSRITLSEEDNLTVKDVIQKTAGCYACGGKEYNGQYIELTPDNSYSAPTLIHCNFSNAAKNLEHTDSSGTFQMTDCLWTQSRNNRIY